MIHFSGQIVSPELLDRLPELPGQRDEDFGLPKGDRLADEVGRAWSDAKHLWDAFSSRREKTAKGESGVGDTRRFWLEPLLSLLGYDPVKSATNELIETIIYAISHHDKTGEGIPLHLVGFRQDLDKRRKGVEKFTPHNLLQEYLNRKEEHLYGIVSNGLTLRLLRDNARIRQQQYIEWDLNRIFEEDRYPDFLLLFRLAHASRLRPLPAGNEGAICWLEAYHDKSIEEGNRIRDELRTAVEQALKAFGTGFLQHPDNESLRQLFACGELTPDTYNRQLRRLVYRLLFLLVAEERELIFPEEGEATPSQRRVKAIYRQHYSIQRLRDLAAKRYRCDLSAQNAWQELLVTFGIFEREEHGQPFGIIPLDGELFHPESLGALRHAKLSNRFLYDALGYLDSFPDKQTRRRIRINYRSLDVEELGSVYESLLDLHPYVIGLDARQPIFDFSTAMERKETGSYYTRHDLVAELIRSALEPVIEDRLLKAGKEKADRETALLKVKVCDPACGSGHFLLAAARRLALELAGVMANGEQPSRSEYRSALRQVIEHCIYGVDMNPDAVELCQVALWLEGHDPGKPLSFLQHKIRCGNSLVGVHDLALLQNHLPDEAFSPVTGDDKNTASLLRKQNKTFREKKQTSLFSGVGETTTLSEGDRSRAAAYSTLDAIADDTLSGRRAKADAFERLRSDRNWLRPLNACHLFTAAYFQRLVPGERYITAELLSRQRETILGASADAQLEGRAHGLAERYRFFHWALEFPVVAAAGGFDVLLGNPPWERIKLQEKEFFATRDPDIATVPNKAARERMIQAMKTENPALYAEYLDALHEADATSRFLRHSGRFPLTAKGDINTYSIFSELFLTLLRKDGRAGFIVPTGIATDNTNKEYFAHIAEGGRLVSLFDFENRKALFPSVHRSFKFSLVTLRGWGAKSPARFGFFLHEVAHLHDPERVFSLTPDDFARLNPNTRTCPVFRTRRDAELTARIYAQVPVLVNEETGENGWGVKFLKTFDASINSAIFINRATLEAKDFQLLGGMFVKDDKNFYPVYEGKMTQFYDHRAGNVVVNTENLIRQAQSEEVSIVDHENPDFIPSFQYWIEDENFTKDFSKSERWFLGIKKVTSSTNERTFIATVIPFFPTTYSFKLIGWDVRNGIELIGNLNSLVFDYFTKLKLGGVNLAEFVINQLPVLSPDKYKQENKDKILPRILELTYTSWDIKAFADDLWREADEPLQALLREQWEENRVATGGHPWEVPEWSAAYPEIVWEQDGGGIPFPPFKWDEERRALLRAELDALYAQLYGLTEEDLRYILDPQDVCGADFPGETFRVLKDKEIRQHGEYRTKRLVLEAWGRL